MPQRRRSVSCVLVAVVVLGGMRQVGAENCRSTSSGESIRWSGWVGEDGKVHYTIGYASGVSSAHIGAFQHAINQWNLHSDDSGIVLEETSGVPDIEIRVNNEISPPACAGYEQYGSYIWFSPAYMAFVVNYPETAATIYAHEIGHALGLAHHSGNTIMNTALFPAGTCLSAAESQVPNTVQYDDAMDARDCAYAAHADHTYGPPPAYFWEQWPPSCYVLWYTEEYWRCHDDYGCWLDFLIDIPWYTDCG
jgi:hypothetical protein